MFPHAKEILSAVWTRSFETFASPLRGRKSLKNMVLKGWQMICLPRAPKGLGPIPPSLSCQNKQGHRGAEGPNRFPPETSASLLKSFSITISASVTLCRIHFSLFFSSGASLCVDLQGAPYPA